MSGIEIRNLNKRWATFDAVKDVTFDVKPGTLTVLLGPSGCGKSTTLRLIAGLDAVTSGQIFIGGKDVTAEPPAKRGLAMVFQSYALYPHLSTFDNIAVPLRMRRLSAIERLPLLGALLPSRRAKERGIRADVVAVAEQLEITPLLRRKPRWPRPPPTSSSARSTTRAAKPASDPGPVARHRAPSSRDAIEQQKKRRCE